MEANTVSSKVTSKSVCVCVCVCVMYRSVEPCLAVQ